MRILFYLFTYLFLSVQVSGQSSDLYIMNATYLDVESGDMKKASISIADGSITSLQAPDLPIDGKRVIDGSGKYIIPGLVDAHIHLFQSGGLYTRPDVVDLRDVKSYELERKWLVDNADDLLKRYLRCGITTVVDVGGPLANFTIRDNIFNSTAHPNLFLTGPLVSTFQPPEFDIEDAPIIKVNSTEAARNMVRMQLPYKPDFIKIWYITLPTQSAESTYDIVAATIDESHKHGLKVAVHATQLNTAKLALNAGADILVHSVDDPLDEDFIALLNKNKATYIPTLIVHRKYVESLTQVYKPTRQDFNYANPTVLGTMFDGKHLEDNQQINQYLSFGDQLNESLEIQQTQRELNLKELAVEGINISLGTDAGNIGTHHASSFYEEISDMKKAGLSNLQIIQSATINPIRALGKESELGSIEVGKKADLVILSKNPIDDIAALEQVSFVVKGGHLIKVDTIIQTTAEMVVQQQLNAYNARNLEAFLAPYSDSVKVYNYPNEFRYQGIKNMRHSYDAYFEMNPNLHCELVNRMVLGQTIIDQEHITGFTDGRESKAIAIFNIVHGKIQEVRFLR